MTESLPKGVYDGLSGHGGTEKVAGMGRGASKGLQAGCREGMLESELEGVRRYLELPSGAMSRAFHS